MGYIRNRAAAREKFKKQWQDPLTRTTGYERGGHARQIVGRTAYDFVGIDRRLRGCLGTLWGSKAKKGKKREIKAGFPNYRSEDEVPEGKSVLLYLTGRDWREEI